MPVNSPVTITLTKDGYEDFPKANLTPCQETCREDFCSRVVAKEPLSKEMFAKSLAAMKKLSDKVIREEAEYNNEEDAGDAGEPEAVSTNRLVKPLWTLKPFWNGGNLYFLLTPFCDDQPLDFDEWRFARELMIAATRPCDLLNAGKEAPRFWHSFAYSEEAGDNCEESRQDWLNEFVELLNGPTMLTQQFSEIDACISPAHRDKFLEEYKAAKVAKGEE